MRRLQREEPPHDHLRGAPRREARPVRELHALALLGQARRARHASDVSATVGARSGVRSAGDDYGVYGRWRTRQSRARGLWRAHPRRGRQHAGRAGGPARPRHQQRGGVLGADRGPAVGARPRASPDAGADGLRTRHQADAWRVQGQARRTASPARRRATPPGQARSGDVRARPPRAEHGRRRPLEPGHGHRRGEAAGAGAAGTGAGAVAEPARLAPRAISIPRPPLPAHAGKAARPSAPRFDFDLDWTERPSGGGDLPRARPDRGRPMRDQALARSMRYECSTCACVAVHSPARWMRSVWTPAAAS